MSPRTAFLIAALALWPAPLSAQTGVLRPEPKKVAGPPIVQAGLFTVRSDGGFGAFAGQEGRDVGADLAGTVYMAPCSSVGASDPGRAVSAAATDVWQMSGRVLALSADQASVQISWRRTRRAGENEASTPLWITLILNRGERATLERIEIPAAGSCEARSGSLDVVFASTQELLFARREATLKPPAGSDGAVRVLTGSQEDVKSTAVALPGEPAPTTLTADLWLVRSAPGRADETAHITSTVMALPRQFGFAPMRIQTSAGVLNVRVEGTVEVGSTTAGERRFFFSANRTVSFAPTNRPPRDAAPVVEGSTKTTVPLPGPDEVLSFEMPALRLPSGEVLPDRLSIRVRLTSVPMREITPPR